MEADEQAQKVSDDMRLREIDHDAAGNEGIGSVQYEITKLIHHDEQAWLKGVVDVALGRLQRKMA